MLRVDDLTGEGFIDLSLEIHAGEIVGLAGLVGSGRMNLPRRSTACARRGPAGYGWKAAISVAKAALPRAARQRAGLSAGRSAGLRAVSRCPGAAGTLIFNQPSWWQQRQREAAVVERYHRALGIKLNHSDQTVRTLSGGNQQECCWPAVWRAIRCC